MRAVFVQEPVLTGREHRRLADVLLKAIRERRPLEPFTRRYPELALSDACRIRDAVLSRRMAAGERLVGAKTRLATDGGGRAEAQLGLLTDGMLFTGGEIDVAALIHPRVEAKLAFVLGRGTWEPDLVTAAVRVVPCLEVVDSRFEPRFPTFLDDVADSFGATLLVLGPGVSPDEISLGELTLTIGARPTALACHPVGWFDGGVLEQRSDLVAGSLLLSPALAPAVDLGLSAQIHAGFGAFGELRLTAG
jgi:2-oxopent-4-enoate/cis-2-oxohex-4-enoate hydratase